MNREELKNILSEGTVDKYSNFPMGRYVTVIVERRTESECIFRTEGSGEGLNKEVLALGLKEEKRDNRAVISKRKQAAVERRTGRETLRNNELLFTTTKKDICALNKNAPCGKCLDCMIYGYAVGDGGAQKSRVIYDNAYSILPFEEVSDVKTFNALFDNGTMRDEEGNASSSINEDEYIKPGTVFLDMVTFKDLTVDELTYALGNILRSSRYGAMSSRIGKIKNSVLKIFVSDCEIFSNLELTQGIYDSLKDKSGLEFPINDNLLRESVEEVSVELLKNIYGSVKEVEELQSILNYIKELYTSKEKIKEILENQSKQYGEK